MIFLSIQMFLYLFSKEVLNVQTDTWTMQLIETCREGWTTSDFSFQHGDFSFWIDEFIQSGVQSMVLQTILVYTY